MMRFMLSLTKTTFSKVCILSLCFFANSHALAQSIEVDQIKRAKEAIANRDWASGESILLPLIQSQPKNPFALYNLAQVYENTNRHDLAKQIYQGLTNTLSADPNKYTIVVRAPYASRLVSLVSLSQSKLNAIEIRQAAAQSIPETQTQPNFAVIAPQESATPKAVVPNTTTTTPVAVVVAPPPIALPPITATTNTLPVRPQGTLVSASDPAALRN